ncbi:hypothetical protein [Scytonema sp. NUACC26]|uniref:hypothetical protein n=1 Tax=Scytonema sp. NUACC26 TaxID=3140176 RepID=UPI0034DC194F
MILLIPRYAVERSPPSALLFVNRLRLTQVQHALQDALHKVTTVVSQCERLMNHRPNTSLLLIVGENSSWLLTTKLDK